MTDRVTHTCDRCGKQFQLQHHCKHDTQPEAQQLADVLEANAGSLLLYRKQAAAELRRLHDKVQVLNGAVEAEQKYIDRLSQAGDRIAALEKEAARWQHMLDVEIARVDPLVARVVLLEAALEQTVEALETYVPHYLKDRGYEPLTTARQTLGGEHAK